MLPYSIALRTLLLSSLDNVYLVILDKGKVLDRKYMSYSAHFLFFCLVYNPALQL